MPKLTIDGREIEVPAGRTIIQAARDLGVHIPHFCWHPELSVAANCRMCLVEIEKQPKLQPSCQILCSEGMVVRTDTERVREARRAMMEFLLLHHPVDCPICDQSGECKLQDYYVAYDRKASRLWSEEHKVAKRKRAVFGPHVVYDAERCVMCTRCVRFCAEVARDPVLCEVHRGEHSAIAVAPGRTLDIPYSLMTAHVCPVGALTSRDFRFQKRVWFLKSADLICPGCATGCAAIFDFDRGRGYRLRPRTDPAVNRSWLCDDGVLAYRLHNDHRILHPRLGRGDDARKATWDEALAETVRALSAAPRGTVGVVLSAEHTCEENHALVRFAREALGAERFFLAARADGLGDDILRHVDKNPNRAGAARVLGAEPEPLAALVDAAQAGAIRTVLALGSEAALAGGSAEAGLLRLETLVVLASRGGSLADAAKVVLPVTSFAETAGTYVNAKGMSRRFGAALPASGEALAVAELLARLGRRLDVPLSFEDAAGAAAATAALLGVGDGGRP